MVQAIDRRPKGTGEREWEGQDLAGQSILLYGEQGLCEAFQARPFRGFRSHCLPPPPVPALPLSSA